MSLSPQQEAFVNHGLRGHARLLAGPGTGKSFTSVAYLESLANADERVRCHMITFTRAATKELQEKFAASGVTITERPPSTAHSFAMWLLMRESVEKLRMADDWEKRHLIEETITLRLRNRGFTVNIAEVRKLTEEMAAGWQSLDRQQIFLSAREPDLAAGFRGAWDEAQRTLEFLHVSEIPFKAVELLEDVGIGDLNLDVLVVDEFQDLNAAEVKLLRLLSSRVQVIAIGDDDQSIYSWRNAAPAALLSFCDDFGGTSYELTVCRRSPAAILDPALEVIGAMPGRVNKGRLTPHDPKRPGRFAQLRFETSDEEFDGVVQLVKRLLDKGVPAEEIAILVRSSADKFRHELTNRFAKVGVQIANTDWVKSALKEQEVRRLVAFARLIVDPADSLAWMGLLHQTEGVGMSTLMNLYTHSSESRATFGGTIETGRVDGFSMLNGASRSRVSAAVDEIFTTLANLTGEYEGAELDDRGWGGWLADRAKCDSLSHDAQRVLEEVGALIMAGGTDIERSLSAFVNQLQPLALDLADAEDGLVRLMSMAQSKGLTVNAAILVAVDNDTIPLPNADEDEERRILYVAMTRATDYCFITTATRRVGATARIGSAGTSSRRRTRFLRGLPSTVPAPVDGLDFIAEF